MRVDWAPLRAELALWRAAGRAPAFWWRDDDAVAETADLHRLLDLGVDGLMTDRPAVLKQVLQDRGLWA